MAKFVDNFNTWALDMFEHFKIDPSVNYFTDQNGRTVVYDVRTLKGAVSVYPENNNDNNFSISCEIGVAYAKLKGYEIPKVATRKNLSQIPDNTDFYDRFSTLYRKLAKHPYFKGDYFVYEHDTNKVFVMSGGTKVYILNKNKHN